MKAKNGSGGVVTVQEPPRQMDKIQYHDSYMQPPLMTTHVYYIYLVE